MENKPALNSLIIIRILDFLDTKSLFECGANLLNKKINSMLDCRRGVLTYKNTDQYYGRQDKESNYLEFPCQLEQPGDILCKVTIRLQTKDQGWASSHSSSFVDLAFLHKSRADLKKNQFEYELCHRLVENRAVPSWQEHFFEFKEEEINGDVFKALSDPNNIAFIHTFCRYGGWEVHMNGTEVKLFYERRSFSKNYMKELEKKKKMN